MVQLPTSLDRQYAMRILKLTKGMQYVYKTLKYINMYKTINVATAELCNCQAQDGPIGGKDATCSLAVRVLQPISDAFDSQKCVNAFRAFAASFLLVYYLA